MNIEIRRAEVNDIDEISEITDACWRENYRKFLTTGQIAEHTGERRKAFYKRLLDDKCDVFVILADGKLSGVCAAQNMGGVAEIVAFYVAPENQRKRLGKQLMLLLVRELRKRSCKMAVLEVPAPNSAAKNFFKKNGFTEQTNSAKKAEGIDYIVFMQNI